MKKFAFILIMAMAIGMTTPCWAAESTYYETPESELLSKTLFMLGPEYFEKENEDGVWGVKVFGKHWVKDRSWGFSAEYKWHEDDYWKIQGSLFKNFLDPMPLLGIRDYNVAVGYSGRKDGSDAIYVGIDHEIKFSGDPNYSGTILEDTSFYWEVKNFFKVNGPKENYVDVYTDSTYYIDDHWSAGLNVIYNHYWTGPDREWLLVGPTLQYNFFDEDQKDNGRYFAKDSLSIEARAARSWTWRDDKPNYYTDEFRVRLKIKVWRLFPFFDDWELLSFLN